MPYSDDITVQLDGRSAELVKTESERAQAAEALGFAGKTDAVNSGLVFGSDDENVRGAGRSYAPPKPSGQRRAIAARLSRVESISGASSEDFWHTAENGGSPSDGEALQALSNGNRSHSSVLEPKRAAVDSLDESDELSGVSSAYDASSGIARLKRRLGRARREGVAEGATKGSSRDVAYATKGTSHSQGARAEGGISGTSHATPRSAAPVNPASTATIAAGGSGAVAHGSIGAASGVASGGSGAVAGGAAGAAAVPIAVAACLLLMLALIAAAFSGLADPGGDVAQLNEVENQVYSFFREKGLDDIHIAAIMGNMKAESGMSPSKVESNGVGIGICQWSYERADSLRAFAASQGKSWEDLDVQLTFFWEHDEYQNEWSATYRVSGDYSNPSPPPGTMVSGSKSGFLAADTVEEATRQFCYGWERAGFPRIDLRIEYALAYYNAFSSKGSGEEYNAASDRQKAVVDACHRTGWPGSGLCATWVSRVFENAGYGYFGGNAEDQFAWWCHSSDRSELKVGMIIAVDDSPTSHWGHVGIYIGDNKVMESVSAGVVETDLDSWISYNGRNGAEPVRWGWCGGIDLS